MAGKRIPVDIRSGKKLLSEKQKAHFARISERWKNPEFRAEQSQIRKDRWANPEFRQKMSKRRNAFDDPVTGPELRAAAGKRIAEFNKTPRAKQLRSINSSENWKNREIRDRMVSGMVATKAEALKATTPTEFELRCYACLDECGVEYERQHPILEAYTIPDAYISERRMCIYFDSEYWHSMPVNAARDLRQRAHLSMIGYEVLVIRCDHKAKVINSEDLEVVRRLLCRA